MEKLIATLFLALVFLKVINKKKKEKKKEKRSILHEECFPNDDIQQPTL